MIYGYANNTLHALTGRLAAYVVMEACCNGGVLQWRHVVVEACCSGGILQWRRVVMEACCNGGML